MTKIDIIRAWKDDSFFASLTDEERALIPINPAGLVELEDDDLQAVGGATGIECAGITNSCRTCGITCLTIGYPCGSGGGGGSTSGYCPTP